VAAATGWNAVTGLSAGNLVVNAYTPPTYATTVTWTAANNPFGTTNIMKIAYVGGKFVALAADGRMAYSSNGINWTLATSPFGTVSNVRSADIVYGNNTFVAVLAAYEGCMVAYSSDGITWTKYVEGSTFNQMGTYYLSIVWDGSKFVAAVGEFIMSGGSWYGKIAYSSDGKSWTEVPALPGGYSLQGIVYYGGKYVVKTNDSSAYYHSTNGTSWEVGDNPFGIGFPSTIAYGNGKYIAAVSPKMFYTTGTAWTAVEETTFNTKTEIRGIAWGGGKFVVFRGYSEQIYFPAWPDEDDTI
jgi:hypothetical protein